MWVFNAITLMTSLDKRMPCEDRHTDKEREKSSLVFPLRRALIPMTVFKPNHSQRSLMQITISHWA